MSPKLAAHSDAICSNGKLFARIEALYDQRATLGLDAEAVRLLERYHTDFVRAGAKLSDADKAKLKAINAELATLATTFSQNVLKETNASARGRRQRASSSTACPTTQIAAAAEAAKARKLDGKYVIALHQHHRPAAGSVAEEPRAARAPARGLDRPRQPRRRVRQPRRSSSQHRQAARRARHAARLPEPRRLRARGRDRARPPTPSTSCCAELAPAAVANARKRSAPTCRR